MEETLTPMPQQSESSAKMTFPKAMEKVIEGKRIARVEWANSDYCFLKGEWLTIFTKGGFHTWLINDGDLLGEDWIVLPDLS